MPLNKRRKYSNFKQFNDACYTALHEAKDEFKEHLGATMKTGGELDFVKMDRLERVEKEIARYNRTLDKLYNKHKRKTEGFTETMERLNKNSLTSPEESNDKG
jgi:predicted nuclease with TOPRIM domain